MRTLVISDLHIGDPRHVCDGPILDILREEKFDRLVLNGDIVDLWVKDIAWVRKNSVVIELAEIAKHKEVIWVIGNHDHKARGQNIIPGAIETDAFHIVEDGKRIMCIHGHQVYEYQNMAWYSRLGTIMNLWLWKTFGIDIQTFYNRGFLYRRYVRRKRQMILKRFSERVDTVIIGHTHLIGFDMTSGRTNLYDAGSTAITRSYVVVEDGCITLKRVYKGERYVDRAGSSSTTK